MTSRVLPMPRDGDNPLALASRQAGLPMGALLVDLGRLAPPDAQRIHEHQARSGQLYGEAGMALGLLTPQDVRAALSLQFGHVSPPRDAGLGPELVAAWQPENEAVEHLRSLRSQLMLRWFENDARHAALAVVSPGRREGRSYVTANLAVLFSQLGKRTLVIDADLRHPRQHRLFGVAGRQGLSGVLAGRLGTDAVVDIPALPGLSLLPAGTAPPNPQELLARGAFTRLLSSLRSSYEVILVDTPAFGGCADAGTVAVRAGAALVLACRDASSLPGLAGLAGSLREFGVTVVGAVLNATGRA
ncbi:chain length determinant protein tyrosine kinase EpsG [Ramlibacter sp. MAHUQ-53]|uniref:chain length determinant protein tyrosine kinase EpsG n=1 Tax=unclassified Ramlibacter TaxID=2617605 RepID=UPI003645AFA3